MFQLFALKVAIAVWKTSIDLSKKLRPRTWMVLAGLNAAISVTALYAYNAKSIPDSAIPPIRHAELKPVPLPESRNVFTVALSSPGVATLTTGSVIGFNWSAAPASSAKIWILTGRLESNELNLGSIAPLSVSHPHFAIVLGGSNYRISTHRVEEPFYFRSEVPEVPWGLPDWPERTRPTVVQVPDSQAPDLLTYLEKRVALAVSVITALLSIVNLFLAFQALRTFKAERELKNLQIAHLRLEVEKLRQEIEDAKREKEKSTGIILVS